MAKKIKEDDAVLQIQCSPMEPKASFSDPEDVDLEELEYDDDLEPVGDDDLLPAGYTARVVPNYNRTGQIDSYSVMVFDIAGRPAAKLPVSYSVISNPGFRAAVWAVQPFYDGVEEREAARVRFEIEIQSRIDKAAVSDVPNIN